MVRVQRVVFCLMIPIHLLCIVWVWLGRMFFGVGGWWLILLAISLVPVLAIALLVTTILAFTQRIPGRRGRITRGQTLVQLALWAALFGFGCFLVDFTDMPDEERSVLTQVVGRTDSTLQTSGTLTEVCAFAAAALYVWLLVLLIIGQRNRPRAREALGPYGPPPYGAGYGPPGGAARPPYPADRQPGDSPPNWR